MMTMERPETGVPEENAPPRCQMGSATKDPCWREATERLIPDRPGFDVCAEHYRACMLAREADEYIQALDKLGAWIAAEVNCEVENRLMDPAYRMREELEEELWDLHVKEHTADRLARLKPGRNISEEAAHEFTELYERGDALSNAIGILEDAPGEVFGACIRWQIVAGLTAVKKALSEEMGCYRRSIGLSS